MKLAVNYSPQARRLTAEVRVFPDLFKCPPWPDLIAEAAACRPVYVHFDLKAGSQALDGVDWEALRALKERTGTPYVNVHLTGLTRFFPHIPHDSEDPRHFDEVAGRMIRDVRLIAEKFGAESVIVENVPYRGGQSARRSAEEVALRAAAEPSVICRIVEETGCGLLLDLNHAWIAAHYMGVDVREYLSGFPAQRLRELHIVGGYDDGERLREHAPMTDEDWDLAEWALGRIHAREWAAPWAVAFEYGGVGPGFEQRSRADVLAEQLPRLGALLRPGEDAGGRRPAPNTGSEGPGGEPG